MAPNAADTQALDDLLTTALCRLAEFAAFLNPSSPSPSLLTSPIKDPPNPLHVLRDAALLTKAHTTKLSLLAINKPFTPSATAKVLRQLAAECLPAMMSAVQICEQERNTWGSLMVDEARGRVRRVFKEMETLLQEIDAVSHGNGNAKSRNSLSSTGVVWESCDAVIELDNQGVLGLAVQKTEQYRDTIKDAIEELREWADGENTDTEGHDALLDEGDEGVDGDRDSVEDLFNAANSMPPDRPELKMLVEEAEGRLKKIVLLYTALIKRRLKTYKPPGADGEDGGDAGDPAGAKTAPTHRLDTTMESLRRIPHQVDDLAGCFYDLDEEGARAALGKCVQEALSSCAIMREGWDGTEDEFTAWSGKWRDAVGG